MVHPDFTIRSGFYTVPRGARQYPVEGLTVRRHYKSSELPLTVVAPLGEE